MTTQTLLWIIATACAVVWAVGWATSTMLGGYIHVLLALAVAVLLFGVIKRQHYKGADDQPSA